MHDAEAGGLPARLPDYAGALRRELSRRAAQWAEAKELAAYRSLAATDPVVLFERSAVDGNHGNFVPQSWAAILERSDWTARLKKTHARRKALPEAKREEARELDSCNSSDALLMNCFCFPGAAAPIWVGLGFDASDAVPAFGIRGRVPLTDGGEDATELDMQLGRYSVEAKLTEQSFTTKSKARMEQYRDFTTVFDASRLPVHEGAYQHYQVIRNVLAAAAHDSESVVLIDQRRPDLIMAWKAVSAAIRMPELQRRCHWRSWQQVAAASPLELRAFLQEKYGIVPSAWESGT